VSKIFEGTSVEYDTWVGEPKTWYHVRFLPLRKSDEPSAGASVAISDITKRRRLEDEKIKFAKRIKKIERNAQANHPSIRAGTEDRLISDTGR